MSIKSQTVQLIAMLCLLASANSHAALITLNPKHSGSLIYSDNFGFPSVYASGPQPLTSIDSSSYFISGGLGRSSDPAGFLLFDVGAASFVSQQAVLQLNLQIVPPFIVPPGTGPLQFHGLDTTAPADLAALGAGEILPIGDRSLLADLQSGTQLGETLVNGDGIYQIQLSDVAVTQINNSAGLWGIGTNWLDEFFLEGAQAVFLSPPELLLTGEPTSVATPPTLPLLLTGILLIIWRRRTWWRRVKDD